MGRFLAFAFDNYYPGGGWHDFAGAFETVEAAKSAAEAQNSDNCQVVDLQTQAVVVEGRRKRHEASVEWNEAK